MAALTSWVRTLVVVVLFCGVLRAVVPAGRMKGAFGFLCAAIVFSTALTGLPRLSEAKDTLGAALTTNAAVSESCAAAQRQTVLLVAQSSLREQIDRRLTDAALPFSVAVVCKLDADTLTVKTLRISGTGTAAQRRQAQTILQDFRTENTMIIWETEDAP